MKPTTKERMGVVERKTKTGAFSAAVLVAGLALGSGCVKDVSVQKPKLEQKVCKANPETDAGVREKYGYKASFKTSQRILSMGEEFSMPGHKEVFKLVKADDKTVEIRMGDMPVVYPYGQEKTIGEFLITLTFRFDKCPDGKVLLTSTHPDFKNTTLTIAPTARGSAGDRAVPSPAGYTEMKKVAGEMMKAAQKAGLKPQKIPTPMKPPKLNLFIRGMENAKNIITSAYNDAAELLKRIMKKSGVN